MGRKVRASPIVEEASGVTTNAVEPSGYARAKIRKAKANANVFVRTVEDIVFVDQRYRVYIYLYIGISMS
jgi:hypothetical protein